MLANICGLFKLFRHFKKFIFRDYLYSQLLRLGQLAASLLARKNIVGLLGNRAACFAAEAFNYLLCFVTLKRGERSRKHKGQPRKAVVFHFPVILHFHPCRFKTVY